MRRPRSVEIEADVMGAMIERAMELREHANASDPTGAAFSDSETGVISVDESAAAANSKISQIALDFLRPAESPDEIGRLGGYRVLSVIGAGGMGVVLLAEDIKLKRQVALKVVKPVIAASDAIKHRFLREAQATAAIEHDHIVSIYQVDEDGGAPFIAMQYLRGESLQSKMRQGEPIPIEEVLRIGREIATGLDIAHNRGLIHRDIKPDNIWLEETTGRVKILDFGLVRATDDESDLTHSGMVVGTPRYMSPEQASGEPVDARGDLFSLGSVLYHLACGQAPFSGGNAMATLMAVSNATFEPLRQRRPDLHPGAAALITRLLARDPAARPQSATEVVAELSAIEDSLLDGSAPTVKHRSVDRKPTPKSRAMLWSGGVAAIAIALLCALWFGGVLFQVRTEQGVILLEIDGAGKPIEVDVSRDKTLIIKDPNDGLPIQVTVDRQGRQLRLQKLGFDAIVSRFELKGPGGQRLRMRFKPDELAAATPKPTAAAPSPSDPADALVAGLQPYYLNHFDKVNINLSNNGDGATREIHDGRHWVTWPREEPTRGRLAWPVLRDLEDVIVDVTGRVEPGADAAWLVVLNCGESERGVTFNINESRVAIHGTIFGDHRDEPPYQAYPFDEEFEPGRQHRLQVVVDGNKRRMSVFFDGAAVRPPMEFEYDITPTSVHLGIAYRDRERNGAVSYDRFATYPLRPEKE